MYERHFKISGSPFQLSPDPAFYFDSPAHHVALGALRQAFVRERPFIVLSGEIGAGKTTVLRVWVGEMESKNIAIGQIANTQLEPDELMRGIATAFGVYLPDRAIQEPDGGVGALLRLIGGPVALLIVDEAQNLDGTALLRLVELADAARSSAMRLRIVLAGQPELRHCVALPELQARLQHASHLGPLDAEETRAYIEHRLSFVGWSGIPSFDATAFDEIHGFTAGIPRRVNVLVNRLMLAKYLECRTRIDARSVIAAAHALAAEIGKESVVRPAAATQNELEVCGQEAGPKLLGPGAIVVVCGGRSDHVKAVPLMVAMACRRDLPVARMLSLPGDTAWKLNRDLHDFAGLAEPPMLLMNSAQASLAQVESAFERLLLASSPAAVVVFDGDERARRCARAACDFNIPLVHIGADAQIIGEVDDASAARSAIARLADRRFGCQGKGEQGVIAHEAPMSKVGNPLIDALHLALEYSMQSTRRTRHPPEACNGFDESRGYGLVALKQQPLELGEACYPNVVPVLRKLSLDLPMLWPMRLTTMMAMKKSGLARTLAGDRIACIEELGHAGFVRLLRDATCVLTDVADVMEEAASLGVPCLNLGASHVGSLGDEPWMCASNVAGNVTKATRVLWEIMFRGPKPVAPPPLWDGHAAPRIAAHLAHWLADLRDTPDALEFARPPG